MTKFKLIFLLLFFSISLQAQNYINETSRWYSVSADVWELLYSVSSLSVYGDTTIDDTQYRIILEKSDWLGLETNGIDTLFYLPELFAYHYIREDSKKIFQWINEQEKLIIDFDLEVGDTIEDGYEPHYIAEIDSFYVGLEMRKIFITNWDFKIFEGIGSQFGLLNGIGYQGPHQWNALKCYSQDNENIELYDDWIPEILTISSCQELTTPIKNNNSNSLELKLYPNPIKNNATIFVPGNESKNLKLSINSIDGKEILSRIEQNNEEGININLATLKAGIYILVVETSKERYSEKIIKY